MAKAEEIADDLLAGVREDEKRVPWGAFTPLFRSAAVEEAAAQVYAEPPHTPQRDKAIIAVALRVLGAPDDRRHRLIMQERVARRAACWGRES